MITQRDKNIVNQNVKDLSITLEVLDEYMKVLDTIEGKLISDSFSIDANSSVRRTYNAELLVTDSSMAIDEESCIWMDKYIRPYVCIKDIHTGEIVKYLKGTFTILDSNYSYDSTTNTLSISCSDLMCTLTGERNGYISYSIRVYEDENAIDVISSLLRERGIFNYLLHDLDGLLIPYEMEFDIGQTFHDVLSEIIGVFSDFEMFFDVNGDFIIQKVPHQDSENVILDADFISPLVISENMNISFKDVYNEVVVWGQQIDADYSTSNCTYDSLTNTYYATIDFSEGQTLKNFDLCAILIPEFNGKNSKLNINGIELYITDDKGDNIPEYYIYTSYNVFKYRQANNDFYWLGEGQVYAEAYEMNENSPFHMSKIGRKIKACSGGEYSKIYSNSLAMDRAKYELWHSCRLKENITLNMIDIPWLDVNWLIEYKSYTTKDTKRYVTKQINGSTTKGTIDVIMSTFYDTDPYS